MPYLKLSFHTWHQFIILRRPHLHHRRFYAIWADPIFTVLLFQLKYFTRRGSAWYIVRE